MKRLIWLDITKGVAILWIVYFHLFKTYRETPSVWAPDFVAKIAGSQGWDGLGTSIVTLGKVVAIAVSTLGFHAVGLFLITSGFSLFQSTQRKAQQAAVSWRAWYGRRLLRLYPMYWVAHLVYLLSPGVARLEPTDWRLLISLTGFRFINIESNFYYLNAAWWYFSLLIQLYLLFPVLFLILRRTKPWLFFIGCCLVGGLTRNLLLNVFPQHGYWVVGGCDLSRLPEFAFGMVLGKWYCENPRVIEKFLLQGWGLLLGLIFYPIALWFYRDNYTYVAVDLLTALCCFLVVTGVSAILGRVRWLALMLGYVGAYSYGIYLVHQPYMIFLGEQIKNQPAIVFGLIALAALAAVSLWGILLEQATNYLLNQAILKPRKQIL